MCRGGKGVPWRLPCRPACIHKTDDRSQDAHQNIIEARQLIYVNIMGGRAVKDRPIL